MGPSEAKRACHPVQLEPAAIDEIAVRISHAMVPLVIEMLRAGGLFSASGAVPHQADGSEAARAMAPGSNPALHAVAPRRGDDAGVLWTARQVAAHYRVTSSFIYGHANELGCIRLGTGPCARLRFDPRVVRERWSTVGQLPDPERTVRKRRGSRRPRGADGNDRGYELLDFDREP